VPPDGDLPKHGKSSVSREILAKAWSFGERQENIVIFVDSSKEAVDGSPPS
jgi:hypothetical protein